MVPLCKLLRACARARALTRTLPPATTAQRDDGVRRQECPLRALWSPGEKDVRGPSRGGGGERRSEFDERCRRGRSRYDLNQPRRES